MIRQLSIAISLTVCLTAGTDRAVAAQTPLADSKTVETSRLDAEVKAFLDREVAAHVADIKTLNPPPERVVGALTTGEFSWGTFMRALADYSHYAGTEKVAGRDVVPMLGRMAEIELGHGGKTWAQLYAAKALRDFGADLGKNEVWQGLTPDEKKAYLQLLDPGRFYNARTHALINLPQNYFGVAARIAVISCELGINKDRAQLDDLLNQASRQFLDGALYADDALPTGPYDRYSNEYARAIYEAAEAAGRKDIMQAVAPSLKEQMKLWWDLLSPDGYGYSWGRSLGAISYMDTLEIAAFLGKYPQFRPAPLPQLAAAYNAAWIWLEHDYNPQTHLLSVFVFGRGNYRYISKEREWQQTTGFLGKLVGANEEFMQALRKEGVESFPERPALADVARFEYFRKDGDRQFGVWVVRQGDVRIALPFVTGPLTATSDYEPAPYGFSIFGVPVERNYPCLVPFLTLDDGTTIAATDGADEIRPATDGKSVTAVWHRWAPTGKKPLPTIDPGLTTEVTWSLSGDQLTRTETISASKALTIRKLWMAVPSAADHLITSYADGKRTDALENDQGTLKVRIAHSDWPIKVSAFATGNDVLGRGDRGPLPLNLILRAEAISLKPGAPMKWQIVLTSLSKERQP
jgi:hypothetical protein